MPGEGNPGRRGLRRVAGAGGVLTIPGGEKAAQREMSLG